MKIRYDNMLKQHPQAHCYRRWRPRIHRYWSGKLWSLEIRGHTLTLDLRGGRRGVIADLLHFPQLDLDPAARALLKEVIWWHSDPSLGTYNGCDTAPCMWCELAKGLLDGEKDSTNILRELHGPNVQEQLTPKK